MTNIANEHLHSNLSAQNNDAVGVETFTGERARGYDKFTTKWIPNYKAFMTMLPSLLQQAVASGRDTQQPTMLIAGCGTGNEMLSLASALPAWHFIGVDPSPEMVDQAKEKLATLSNVDVLIGLVSDLPLASDHSSPSHVSPYDSNNDQSSNTNTISNSNSVRDSNSILRLNGKPIAPMIFDGATLLLVLHFLSDHSDPKHNQKLAVLTSIAKRLASNAPLITLDITGEGWHMDNNLMLLKALVSGTTPQNEVDNRLYRIKNTLYPVSESRFIELCKMAGFTAPTRFFQTTIYTGWIMQKRGCQQEF